MSDQPTVRFPTTPEPPRNHRHAWRIALIAALSVLAVLLPLATYLVMRGEKGEPRPAAPVPGPPSPGVSTPGSPPASSPARRAPDGHLPLATLKEATLTIPPWPADNFRGPSGRLRFHDGQVEIAGSGQETPPTGMQIVILSVSYGDVDRDGRDETLAEIGCLIENGSKQVVAFDRDTTGRIITLGTVVATTGEIREIETGSTRVGSDGVVTVRVGDYQVCCDDRTPQTWQRRGYHWRHGRFAQCSGPTRMGANPAVTETTVSAGELILGPVVDGYRYGTLPVTVRHRWGARPATVRITFLLAPGGLERAGTAWPPVTAEDSGFSVDVPAPAARSAALRTFAFRRAATGSGRTLDVGITGLSRSGNRLSEAVVWNNGVTATIRTAD